jgi:hypothetical protein
VKVLWVGWRIIIPFWGVSCAFADSGVCIVQLPNQKKFWAIPEPRKKKRRLKVRQSSSFSHQDEKKCLDFISELFAIFSIQHI